MESEKIVKKFIKLAKEEGLAELKFEDKAFKIELKFPKAESSIVPVYSPAPSFSTNELPSSSASQASPSVSSEAEQKKVIPSDNFHAITSPLVGTFYASSSPGKASFVEIGSRVTKGQTLCIVEAMKIMNEIESDVDGEIVEICIDNESVVEFGQVLFKIRT